MESLMDSDNDKVAFDSSRYMINFMNESQATDSVDTSVADAIKKDREEK
jgi:hypothetical protein